jgi:hypothetical protein
VDKGVRVAWHRREVSERSWWEREAAGRRRCRCVKRACRCRRG